MKRILRGILWVGLFLSIIQFIRMTIMYIMIIPINKSNPNELLTIALEHNESYYLLMLIIVICAGALAISDKSKQSSLLDTKERKQ